MSISSRLERLEKMVADSRKGFITSQWEKLTENTIKNF